MDIQQLMTNYAAYNRWANETLCNWLAQYPVAIIEQTVPSSFNSAAATIVHLLETETFWLSFLRAAPHGQGQWQSIRCATAEALTRLPAQSAECAAYVGACTPQQLTQPCPLNQPWMQGVLPRYEYIQHCMNHSSYHRGQVITIARLTGLTDPPNTDYNYYNMVVKNR